MKKSLNLTTTPYSGVETTNQFHAAGKTAWGINMLQAKK
jgi:hypothetical protein